MVDFMRELFRKQLEALHTMLIEMGALCEQVIDRTYKVILAGDKKAAAEIIEKDSEIDMKEREIESACLKLLLHQQPVATDLRQISAALKMITDMERIGDQASDIADIVKASKDLNISAHATKIGEMSQATMKMVTDSIDSFVKQDLDIARQVIVDDDRVDNLFIEIKHQIAENMASDLNSKEQALDMLMIAKYYERIGDHATNIAEWVEFAITGQHRKEEK